jgi:general stress protein 26
MTTVDTSQKEEFFNDVEAAAKKAIWCALATVDGNEPRVRMVHPTWEGDVLWIATGPQTPKAQQVMENSAVDIQFQVAPDDFIHLLVRGRATVLTDAATKARVWDVMDYDMTQFWPDGAGSDQYCVIKVEPSRVELSEMFGSMNKRVWRA